MSSNAVSGGELEQCEFNFVELIQFGIHSPDYLFTADKYIHEALLTVLVYSLPVYTFGTMAIHLDCSS